MTKEAIARWESPRGKYWLELYREHADGLAPSYSYKSDNGGGFQGSRDIEPSGLDATDRAAISAFERISLPYQFPGRYRRVR